MESLFLLPSYFLPFLLVWMRLLGLFLIAPVFNSRLIPIPVKVGLSFMIALVMALVILPVDSQWQFDGRFFLALFSEIVLGLVLGLVAGLILSCVQIAGEIIDFQMGFSYVNIVDPLSNLGVSVMGQFYFVLTTIYYLGVGGHRLSLLGLARSFELVPLGTFAVREEMAYSFIDLVGEVTVIGIQVGAPIIVALFLSNFTLAILSRAIPQMNVFIVGLPLNIGIGFFLALITLPYFLPVVNRVISLFFQAFYRFLGVP